MRGSLALILALGLAAPAAAEEPLSAIDWLSDVTTTPIAEPPPPPLEEQVSRGVVSETITVTPLDAPSPDATGLLPSTVSGLPRDLWGPSTGAQLRALLARIDGDDLLPQTRELLFTLLLAELDAPAGATADGTFLLARVDTLRRLGAIEQAHAMLDRAGIATADQFEMWFDLSLFLGSETGACALLQSNAGLSRDFATRTFCLARTGDWASAAVTFETARALGQLDAVEEAVLLRFLDVALDDTAAPLSQPSRPSPLVFHLFEAIGEPLPTTTLPVAFAVSDLRPNVGWKAQIEAAERLARVGAISANQLLGLYTERRPAASGGVWERVAAVQAFDQALATSDTDLLQRHLPRAWAEMQAVGLEMSFADLYGARLTLFDLPGESGDLAHQISLLTDGFEEAADPRIDPFFAGIATAQIASLTPPTPMAGAIADAFSADAPPTRYTRDIERRAIGAALLQAIDLLGTGKRGDLGKVTEALSLFRFLGLETVARRTALELLILSDGA
ncbi:MAG: hypothetical protein AAGP08_01150 [Pseudomonadota bacterium]